jgi:hypothetical protein
VRAPAWTGRAPPSSLSMHGYIASSFAGRSQSEPVAAMERPARRLGALTRPRGSGLAAKREAERLCGCWRSYLPRSACGIGSESGARTGCSLSRARNRAACSATRFSSRSAIRSCFQPRTAAALSLSDVVALSLGVVIATYNCTQVTMRAVAAVGQTSSSSREASNLEGAVAYA